MKRRIRMFSLLLLVTVLLLATACQSKGDSTAVGNAAAPEVGKPESIVNNDLNRKIVYHVSISMDSEDVTACKNAITEKCRAMGGYVENNGESYENGKCTSANVTYRIPTERLDEFIASIEGQGKVARKNIGTTDITTTYVNAEARKTALEERKALLEQLLNDPTISASDRIAVINEISSVNTELEAVLLLITQYDSQVDYSTVTVSINEPVNGWEIALIIFLVLLIQIGLPVLIILLCIRARRKKREKKETIVF